MPRKVDACMFCMETPCVCEGTKKPKRLSKQKSPSSQDMAGNVRLVEVNVPPPTPRGEAIDLKAAMRKAANPQVVDKPVDNFESDDPELIAALAVLEPILHPDERSRFSLVLEKLGTRAQRWKMRRHGA